jgi:cobyrinic acid a,c-diamide synthase
MSPPGLVIAAPRSGSGKTTLTLGLLRAFRRAGLAVGGAKCGPDYIDPAFHEAACGRPSLNLDSWAMPPGMIADLAARSGAGCDLVICEALMGLFDGVPGQPGRSGSSADVAAALGWPVLLVVDASGQSQSAAAIVKGCATYDPRIRIAGVVLNRLGSARHARLAGDAIAALGIPVVGALPRSDSVALPERHLGLIQALASPAEPPLAEISDHAIPPPGRRIAIARDAAFSFLYPHLLQSWRRAGAEFRFFSPLADESPDADCDAAWLPGGYPELHAGRLAASRVFRDGLRRFALTRPVHGECGGYMALGQSLTDADGVAHEMVGLLGVSTSFARRKPHLGYREARLAADTCLGRAGSRLRGHEFHYAGVDSLGGDEPFAHVSDAYGGEAAPAGGRRGLVSGSFFHVIAAAP